MPAALLAATLSSSCADLSPYPLGECGNSVVETGEQCDRHADAGQRCGDPGTAVQCRYLCAETTEDGEALEYACPLDQGCGVDGVCRAAAGTFTPGFVQSGFAYGTRLADFNGDGTDDLLTRAPTRIDVRYFDASRAVINTQSLGGEATVIPFVGDVDASIDATGAPTPRFADTVFSEQFGLVVALGSAAGLVPRSYAGLRPATRHPIEVFSIPGSSFPGLDLADAFAVARTIDAGYALFHLDREVITNLFALPSGWGDVPHATTGNFDRTSDTCEEVLFTYVHEAAPPEGESSAKKPGGLYTWRPCPIADVFSLGVITDLGRISIQESAGIEPVVVRPGSLVDIDGDGNIDVVVEVDEEGGSDCPMYDGSPVEACKLYASLGDGEGGFVSPQGVEDEAGPLRSLIIPELRAGVTVDVGVTPLAWGDFNADGLADLVDANGVYLHVPEGPPLGPDPDYFLVADNRGVPWIQAFADDFDGDGRDDVVALPQLSSSLTFLRSSPAGNLGYADLQLDAPVFDIDRGDFDGDGRLDLLRLGFAADLGGLEVAVHYFEGSGFGPAVRAGTFDATTPLPHVATGRLRLAPDALDDFAVVTASGEDAAPSIALFEGRADRQPVSPIRLPVERPRSATVMERAPGERAVVSASTGDVFYVDLDANAATLGDPQAVPSLLVAPDPDPALGRPPFLEPPLTPLAAVVQLAAGDLDGEAGDELVAVVPGCEEVETGEFSARIACVPGTEISRVIVLDGDLSPIGAIEVDGLGASSFVGAVRAISGQLVLRDLDADGDLDVLLMLTHRGEGGVLESRIVALANDGQGHLDQPVELPAPPCPPPTETVDLVGVRGVDAAPASGGPAAIYVGTSCGVFRTAMGDGFVPAAPELVLGTDVGLGVTDVATGDVDGDGLRDLVVTYDVATVLFFGDERVAEPRVETP